MKILNYRYYSWNRQKIEKHQQKKIVQLIKFLGNSSQYYSEIIGKLEAPVQFHDLPVIDKEIMMDNFNSIITADLDRDTLVDFRVQQEKEGGVYELFDNRFSIGLSSGTSSNKSLTVLSKKEISRYSSLIFARSGIPSHIKTYRILFALRRNNPTFQEVGKSRIKMIYIDYTMPIGEIIDLINDKKLNILAGPPSLLRLIAKQRSNINSKIDTLISYAEILTDEVQNELEMTFDVPVVQIYQGAEGMIASSCSYHRLHLNEDLLYFEFETLDMSNPNIKKIIITDLYRRTHPIVRYSINDLVELEPKKCGCGSSFKLIKKIHGRMDDVFHLENNKGGICYLFPDYVRRSIIQASNDIIDYQAIQTSIHEIELRVVIADIATKKDIQSAIISNLENIINKLDAKMPNIYFSDGLPEKNPISHKLIRVVRKFNVDEE